MKWTLYNKNTPLLTVDYDDDNNSIDAILKVHNPEYLPVHLHSPTLPALRKWWSSRSIPAERNRINEVLADLNIPSTSSLVSESLGLSLSDQYWIKPIAMDVTWKDVNFFTNEFTDALGDLLLLSKHSNHLELHTPNNTSDGWLQKKWTIIDGVRNMVKGGSGLQLEPFNERFASLIHQSLNPAYHLSHTLERIDGKNYSVCPCMVTEDTELVSADKILQISKKPNHMSTYQHLISMCEQHSLLNAKPYLDYLIATDYLIRNTDRHFGNFGIIRDINTLKWLDFAPIYDSGTSMWNLLTPPEIKPAANYKTRPFRTYSTKQNALISPKTWQILRTLPVEEYMHLFDEVYDEALIGFSEMKSGIRDAFNHRIEHVLELGLGYSPPSLGLEM